MSDNQEKRTLWFKAKRYGWGWQPCSWQGWAVLALYLFGVCSDFFFTNLSARTEAEALIAFIPRAFTLTVFLLIICRETGEKPRWRWGEES